jgi:hypothetical protein
VFCQWKERSRAFGKASIKRCASARVFADGQQPAARTSSAEKSSCDPRHLVCSTSSIDGGWMPSREISRQS